MRARLGHILLALVLFWPVAAAGETASLVADSLRIEADSRLVAEGDVEILYEGTRLRAARLIFDQRAGRLTIEGPITLTEGDRVVIVADQAELSEDLRDGILTSARLVLDRQLQLAANRIDRIGGRYTQLSRAVTSSCRICEAGDVPAWEIRARRVIHDQQERQIYFDQAVFRLGGVPVMYIPRLRLPDPTRDRATGFLVPSLRTTSQLETGVKLPYFIALGDHADLRLTPYLSPATRTVELGYRHEFGNGRLTLTAAITDDDLVAAPRYYLFAEGRFRLPAGFRLDLDAKLVSDPAYLLDYGYSAEDRLQSEVRLSRIRRDALTVASVYSFQTLRDSEVPIADELPAQYALFNHERRIDLGPGTLTFGLDAAGLIRESQTPTEGRDMARLGASAWWRQSGVTPGGLVATVEGGAAGHLYAVWTDPTYDAQTLRLSTGAAVTLRWPLQRTTAGGAHLTLQPVAQLAYTATHGGDVPNEDSPLVEFDEGNLFALNRFPGEDAIEEGLRANLGLGFSRHDPSGWSMALTLGRVIRFEDAGQFLPGTGLDGGTSDWLAALQLRLADRLHLGHRMLFDDSFSVTRAESRLDYSRNRLDLGGSYLYMIAEPLENRPDPTHEVALDAGYRMTRHWRGRLDGRFDLVAEQAAEAGLGFEYRSECLSVDLSLSRRFATSTSVAPSTDIGLQVSLAGLGGNPAAESYRRACSG